jgi:hypothetical protein
MELLDEAAGRPVRDDHAPEWTGRAERSLCFEKWLGAQPAVECWSVIPPMTIVVDGHPVLSAVVASGVVAMLLAGSVWLAAYSLWDRRSMAKGGGVRGVVVGVVGTALWLLFGVGWWHGWSPWAVELTDDAVELKYLLSTRRIELTDLERVEFELVEAGGRGRERSILRLSAGGRVYQVTQDPEPAGELATRPVRRVFDELAARVPPRVVRDGTKEVRRK